MDKELNSGIEVLYRDGEHIKSLDISDTKVNSITIDVGQWRNAYAIREWFQDILGGIENCTSAEIFPKWTLVDLLDKCQVNS